MLRRSVVDSLRILQEGTLGGVACASGGPRDPVEELHGSRADPSVRRVPQGDALADARAPAAIDFRMVGHRDQAASAPPAVRLHTELIRR